MSVVAVVVEHDRGAVPEAAFEALTAGRSVAEGLGASLVALVMGEGADGAVHNLGQFGAAEVISLTAEALEGDYSPEAWGQAVASYIAAESPTVVMSVGTDRGNEILAQAAARAGLPFVANCVEVDADVSEMTRSQWGGALLERTALNTPTKLLTFGHHAVEAAPASSPAPGSPREVAVEVDAALSRTRIKDRVVLSEGITLSTAPVVIGGGRGVGSAEAFAPLEELAEMLAGKVGCSRAVTNNGWRPHADQVGQTGTRIAPTIYVACGISGATQHWVGAMGSKNILAINTDAEANMVTKAGWAVIGDLHQVVPAIAEEIRRRG